MGAQLQGASLDDAQLQGASLVDAQLQGASFEEAALEATDLSRAYLWRNNSPAPPSEVAALRMSGETWLPDDMAYQALRTTIESLPAGRLRDQALKQIRILDCAVPAFESCDYLPPPVGAAWWLGTQRDAVVWREALEKAARVDEQAYAEALAKVLTKLVCSGGGNAIYVLRGAGFHDRLKAAGAAGSGLIDDLTSKDSKDCPVAASLTDADRAELLHMKQAAIKKPEH